MIWPYIILSYLSLFALGLSDNIRGPLFPEIMKSFSLNDTQGAFIFAFSASASLIGSLSGAYLLKKMNKIRVLDIGLGLCSLGLLGMGLSSQFYIMLIACLIFGFSMGVMGVCQNTLAAIGAPKKHRGQVLAGLHSMYGLASLLAPLFVGIIWSHFQNWRLVFCLTAIVPLLIAFYSVVMAPIHEEKSREVHHSTAKNFSARFWMALMLGSYVVTEIMVSSRLALYMNRVKGMDLKDASMYVSSFFVFLLIGRLICTFKHFKKDLKFQLISCILVSIILIVFGLSVHPFGLVLSGLSMAPVYPLAVSYMAEKFPHSLESTISVAMATQSFLIVIMHISIGSLTDIFGIQRALYLGPIALLISVFMLVLFERIFDDQRDAL